VHVLLISYDIPLFVLVDAMNEYGGNKGIRLLRALTSAPYKVSGHPHTPVTLSPVPTEQEAG